MARLGYAHALEFLLPSIEITLLPLVIGMAGETALYRRLKRCLDLVLGVVFLVLLAPFLLGIGIAIRLNSRGPATFRQDRVGLRGRRFKITKFRTMTVDSPTFGPKPKSFDDERITGVGRFLRRTSLDELPQLLNVVKGEMSLVGPRPEQPFLVARYASWQLARLSVLPGMTGWWQINGRKQPMHEYVEEDLYYVLNRSLLLDIRILLCTFKAVIRGDGAV
jgi:lipopolysaccharide/colanic/teichoic acid biosynthesis glycosyltransferase